MKRSTPILLVPGAWMGGWIWDDMVDRLTDLGHDARTMTLPGCRPDDEASAVSLADHVDAVVSHTEEIGCDRVVLVGHSYSGVVVGHVADRLGSVVQRSVHVGSFLPHNGRSLLDDWGDSTEDREAEKQQVIDDGWLWLPPPPPALEGEPDLTPDQREWLSEHFVPHPGRTVSEPAVMKEPVTAQTVTFIGTAPTGRDPLETLPPEVNGDLPATWELRTFGGGHWPMVTLPAELCELIHEESCRDNNE